MNKEMLKQWTPVDVELFKQMIHTTNEIKFGRKTQKEFDELVLKNKDKLDNPDYAQIFVEQAELTDEYYEEHEQVCDVFYEVLSKTNDWRELNLGLRQYMRMEMFVDEYKKFKENKKSSL